MPSLAMRTQLVSPALALVREAGGDAEALARRFNLPESAARDPEVALPLHELHAFLDAAAAAARDSFLGLRIAARYRRGMYGLMEFTSRTAPTLRDACARVARYVALTNELVVITFTEEPARATITQKIAGAPLCVGRHGNEFFACALLLQARAASGVPIVPERVFFAHAEPKDTSELREVLGTRRIDFATEANGLVLGSAALSLPILASDPPLLSLLEQQAEEALAARGSSSRLLGRVRQSIRERLHEDPPTLEDIARTLKTSPRTLQRRLGDEGSTFQQLVDAVREEIARLRVAEGKLSLAEVAFALGYAEQGAFFRAFKRWTGMTPSEFRRTC